MTLIIEPLGKQHDRNSFACGRPELDDWFRHRASQDEKRGLARVFVAVDGNLGVVGFYSLSAFSFSLPDLPDDIGRKLPRYEAIPAALIGRLARHVTMVGKNLGALLVTDAIRRALSASRSLALFAIVVEAKDERAANFYRTFGFVPFVSKPDRLFILGKTAAASLGKE